MKITITRNDSRSYTATVDFENPGMTAYSVTAGTAYEAVEQATKRIKMIEEGAGIPWES